MSADSLNAGGKAMVIYMKVAALMLIAGILLGEHVGGMFAVCFLLAFLLANGVLTVLRHEKINIGRICVIAFLCLGILLSNLNSDGGGLDDYEERCVTLTGRIEAVTLKDDGTYRYVLDARKLVYDGTEENIKEKISVTTEKKYKINDTINVLGMLKTPKEASNEYGFDSERYYKIKDINYKIHALKIETAVQKIKMYSVGVFVNELRYQISELIHSVSDGDKAEIIEAVIIGEKNGFSEELDNALVKSGSMRFLYTFYFFIMAFMMMLNCLRDKISENKRTYIMAALVILTALFNSENPIFIKGGIFFTAILLIRKRMGYVYKTDVLGAAVIAMLISNPMLIHYSGFVLSVCASALMILFSEKVTKKLHFIRRQYVRRIIASGLICKLGLAPLTAYYFNMFTPYTLITALVYFPANLMIWLCFWPGAILMKLFGTAPIFSQFLSAALAAYTRLPYLITKLPYSYIYVSRPNIIIFVIFALLIFAAYRRFRNKDVKPILAAAGAAVILLVTLQIPRLATIEMTFINVGQGDGALVSVPYRENVLIDGGGYSIGEAKHDAGDLQFVPYLISHGKTKIDAAFISHYHTDHANGIIDAIETLNVKHLFLPGLHTESPLKEEAERAAKANRTTVHYISEDMTLRFDSGMVIEITVPDERVRKSDDENDESLMINVIYGDVNCLFTGDMTKFSENSLLAKNKVPEAEILKVAHHGSATSTGSKWVEMVDPDISIISVGENNSYGLPKESVLKTLSDTEIYRTDKNGDITITADKNRVKNIRTYK